MNRKRRGVNTTGAITKRKKSVKEVAKERMDQARFRMLNEMFYTTESGEMADAVQKDNELLHSYHRGFRTQVDKWPVKPLELITADVARQKGAVVGDFGCGDAMLSLNLQGTHTVHSFDLIAANPRVTACDISKVPLDDASLDVAVFSLSLMGTNYPDFIREAVRCLRPSGRLVIAEVGSRFMGEKGSVRQAFVKAVEALGFRAANVDDRNYFVLFFFERCKKKAGKAAFPPLTACKYKRR